MIEILLKNELQNRLGIPVLLEKPSDSPPEFVVIQKLGSHKENHIGGSSFAFQSYSGSLYSTALLNERVKEAVEGLVELDSIVKVRLDSDYQFNDMETKEYRYQAVFDINHY